MADRPPQLPVSPGVAVRDEVAARAEPADRRRGTVSRAVAQLRRVARFLFRLLTEAP